MQPRFLGVAPAFEELGEGVFGVGVLQNEEGSHEGFEGLGGAEGEGGCAEVGGLVSVDEGEVENEGGELLGDGPH